MATTRAKTSAKAAPKSGVITVETRIGMIEYAEIETPVEVSSAVENPHARGIARVKELMTDASKSLSIVIPAEDKVKHENYLRRGANAEGFTMRIVPTEITEGTDAGKVRLTFRGIERIERKRLTPEEKAAREAAKAAKAASKAANSNQHQ